MQWCTMFNAPYLAGVVASVGYLQGKGEKLKGQARGSKDNDKSEGGEESGNVEVGRLKVKGKGRGKGRGKKRTLPERSKKAEPVMKKPVANPVPDEPKQAAPPATPPAAKPPAKESMGTFAGRRPPANPKGNAIFCFMRDQWKELPQEQRGKQEEYYLFFHQRINLSRTCEQALEDWKARFA